MAPSLSGTNREQIADRFIRDLVGAMLSLRDRDFVEKLKGMKIKGSAKDQPSYRMVQSIDA
jgi:hypothetical protein